MNYNIRKKYISPIALVLSITLILIANFVSAANVQVTQDVQLKLDELSAPLYVKAGSSCDSFTVSGSHLSVAGIPDGENFSLGTVTSTILEVKPSGGIADMGFDSSHFSGDYINQWTINKSEGPSIRFIVKVAEANSDYLVKVNGKDYNYYSSDNNGQITFSYEGAFSTDKVFTIVRKNPIVRKNRPSSYTPYPSQFDPSFTKEPTKTQAQLNQATTTTTTTTTPSPSKKKTKGIIPSGFVFKYNLRPGVVSNDVRYLQIILNTDPDTRVANTGPGSPGQETDYFGPLTKAAVIRFQEKYSKEILTPWGLAKGTGFVGKTTRAKLNEISKKLISGLPGSVATTTTTVPLPGKKKTKGIIPVGFVFKYNLYPGLVSDDVKYLQIILNTDPDTRVANTGPGSPGQETDYFGPLTKAAVIRFQEKYSKEILTPWGLAKGTGFVGKTTRAKLNEISKKLISGLPGR